MSVTRNQSAVKSDWTNPKESECPNENAKKSVVMREGWSRRWKERRGHLIAGAEGNEKGAARLVFDQGV